MGEAGLRTPREVVRRAKVGDGTVKVLILVDSFQYAEHLRKLVPWEEMGFEIIGTEYNAAIAIEQFQSFKPKIVLLDALVPIIGVDRFINTLREHHSDFMVLLLDDSGQKTSNIQHVFRILPKSDLSAEQLSGTLERAINLLHRKNEGPAIVSDSGRFKKLSEALGQGDFSLEQLQKARDALVLDLAPNVHILLPRPSRIVRDVDKIKLFSKVKAVLHSYNGGEVFQMDNGSFCVLVNEISGSLEQPDEARYDLLLYELRVLLEDEYQTHFTFFFSDLRPLSKLNSEYQTIEQCYRQGFYLAQVGFLRKSHLPLYKSAKAQIADKVTAQLLRNLGAKHNQQQVKHLIDDIYLQLKKLMDDAALRLWQGRLEMVYRTLETVRDAKDEGTGAPFDRRHQRIEDEQGAVLAWFQDQQQTLPGDFLPLNPHTFNVLAMVINQYEQDILLNTVADKIGVTTTYLSHLFKKDVGVTFTAYLTEMRLLAAKRLIRTTDQKIHAIAAQVGFWDYRYFSHVFRKVTGATPTEYRGAIQSNRIPA